MLGLIYLGAAALYLATMLAAVAWAWRYGRRTGASHGRAALYASGAFLLVYLPVFWNHIPIVLKHRALCQKDAGFVANVSPIEWARTNQDLIARLRDVDLTRTGRAFTTTEGFHRGVDFNGVRAWDSRSTKEVWLGVPVYRVETRLVDLSANLVLASDIDYQTGSSEHIAFWLRRKSCFGSGDRPEDKMITYSRQMREQIK